MELLKNIRKEILDLSNEISKTRRHFHQYPELSFKEHQTQKYILDFLKNENIEHKVLCGTGIIATIYGARPGKTIALRADMDALNVQEDSTHEYKSKIDGVMHACGHDGHMTIVLYATKLINDKRDQLEGNVRIIFQPAEETIGGAQKMIDEGALKNPDVDEAYALHLWGVYPLGEIRTKQGPIMATNNEIEIVIEGKSGHGAMPHHGIDSIVVAAQFITNLQAVVARNISPFSASVITFGTINGGSARNVLAPSVKLTGTIRSMSDDEKAFIISRINDVLEGTCRSNQCKGHLNIIKDGAYITLVNDEKCTEKVKEIARGIVGSQNVLHAETMGAEDFSFIAKEVPSCYFFLGASNEQKGITYPQHHSKFDIDEDSLLIGIEMFMRIVNL